MKIAKVKATPKEISKQYGGNKDLSIIYVLVGIHDMQLQVVDQETAKVCFEMFDSPDKLKDKMKKRENIWAHYVFKKQQISPETQLRYESFFSGYLHFYDTESRNGMSDHTIWLDWQKNKSNQDVVTVYIYPAPLRHPLIPNDCLDLATKSPDEYVDLMKKKNKKMKETIYNPAWNPPDVEGFQSDPPSPSGPPPPYPA